MTEVLFCNGRGCENEARLDQSNGWTTVRIESFDGEVLIAHFCSRCWAEFVVKKAVLHVVDEKTAVDDRGEDGGRAK